MEQAVTQGTSPSLMRKDVEQPEQCRWRLEDAGISPDSIDYINAHGTSTPLGDKAETLAIKKVFSEHSKSLVVSSIKSHLGHTLGASGGIELVACAMLPSTT